MARELKKVGAEEMHASHAMQSIADAHLDPSDERGVLHEQP